MTNRLPKSPTPKNFAEAVVAVIEPLAIAIGGADLRVTKSEVKRGVSRGRVSVQDSELASETILRQLQQSGAKKPTTKATVAGIGRRALRAAQKASGPDQRLSGADAMKALPSDLARLFAHLRTAGAQAPMTNPADADFAARARTAYGESIEVGLATPTVTELPPAARAKYEQWLAQFPEPGWTIRLSKLPFEGDTLFAVYGVGNGGDFVPTFHELFASDGTSLGHAYGGYGAAETWAPHPNDPSA